MPVSGAAQLKAMGAIAGERPISSHRTPYSQLVRPGAELVVGQEEVPKAVGLRLLAKLADDGRVGDARSGAHLVVERLHRLELHREHLGVDERPDAFGKVNDAGAEIEVQFVS